MFARPFIQESNLGMAKCDLGVLDEGAVSAEDGYEAAVARGEKSAHAWLALILGRVYPNTGQLVRADRLFPEGAAAYGGLGRNEPRRWWLEGRVLVNVGLGCRGTTRSDAGDTQSCPRTTSPALAVLDGGTDLTDRLLEIARLAVTGLASKSIARRLGLSARTVDNHRQKVYLRPGLTSRDDLAGALSDDPSHL